MTQPSERLAAWLQLVADRGDRKLSAYYFSFDATGDPRIDLLLASVATAGKLAHHTESWADDEDHWSRFAGGPPADMIQELANLLAAGWTP